jgi:hypothetical protein
VTRRVAANGLVSVGWQQVSVGKHYGGSACDVLVGEGLLQFWLATNSSRPWRALGVVKSARRTPPGPPAGTVESLGASSINRR